MGDLDCAEPWIPIAKVAVPGLVATIYGSITERCELDRAFSFFGQSDAALLEAAYERFGSDAFLRLPGRYAAAIADKSGPLERTVLAVQPGSPIGLWISRAGNQTRFAPEPIEGGELLEPGVAATLEPSGRLQKRAFYSFSPLLVPRRMSREAAWTELDRALGRAIARRPAAERVAVLARDETRAAELLRHLPRLTTRVIIAEADQVPSAELLLSDLGARELFGETARGRSAFVLALSRAFEAEPSFGSLQRAFRLTARVAPRESASELTRAIDAVARRWSRHLPPKYNLAQRSRPLDQVPEITGNAFVDHRYAQVTEAAMYERLRAAFRAAEGRYFAPYLDPEVIETMFSLPPEYFAP
jgi:hypothetical protein